MITCLGNKSLKYWKQIWGYTAFTTIHKDHVFKIMDYSTISLGPAIFVGIIAGLFMLFLNLNEGNLAEAEWFLV